MVMDKTKILIVEDELIVAEAIKSSLESMGYEVVSMVKTGEAAIEKAEKDRPDVILMNIRLKGKMDGIEAADRIRSRLEISIIFLTAYADEERLERAKLTLPFGYVLKPFQDRDLKVAIEMALYAAKVDTERKKAEGALRESEDRLLAIIDKSPIPTALGGSDGSIISLNDAVEELTGYKRDEITDVTDWANRLYPDKEYRDFVSNNIQQALRGEKQACTEFAITRKDGSVRTVDFHTSFFKDGLIIQMVDITERKRAEEEKARLEAQLQQAQKMEAIGTLAGGIAHDFNNILGVIIGCTELSLLDVPRGFPARPHLIEVLKAGNRAKDLVKQILAFSRHSEQERKPVQPGIIVKEALKMLRSSLPSTIQIRQYIKKEPGIINADSTQIHQVLMNLCTNAAHAMREKGGILKVNLSNVDFDAEAAEPVPDLTPGSYINLTVSDAGHGMDSKTMERILDPYFTTKATGEGTGLGLAVAHGIVRSYGGAIKVVSEPGKGSTFEVFIPRIDYPKDLPETGEPAELPTGNERILFVDDEETLVYAGQAMLERLGYEVIARTSSVEALEAFRAQPDKFDLVVTDMTMPNKTGTELARELLQIRPDIPIILCTGFSEVILEETAKTIGIREFIIKPIVMKDMAETVRKVLDKT